MTTKSANFINPYKTKSAKQKCMGWFCSTYKCCKERDLRSYPYYVGLCCFNLRKLTLQRFILLQKGTDFLRSEGICTWRYSSEQGVMLSLLQTELFQICSCLGNLHAVEPGLQPELLNHFIHSGDAGGTRHGARESWADRQSVGGSVVGPPRVIVRNKCNKDCKPLSTMPGKQ